MTVLRLIAALTSGAVLVWVAPPVNLHWLHWFSFLPLFWAMREGEGRKNALLAYAAGWIAQFLIFFWLIDTIVIFSNIPWVLALLVHILFASFFALPYAIVFSAVHWFRRRLGTWWVLAIPLLQVAVERVFPQLFPYYQGVGQYRTEWVWQLTSVTGVMGLSFLILLTNSALAEIVYRRREGRPLPYATLAVVAVLFLSNLGFGAWRSDRVETALEGAPVVRVAMLQQNTTMEKRLQESALESLATWVKVTQKIVDDKPDLVVWPEGAVPFNPHSTRKTRALGKRSPKEYFEEMTGEGNFDLLIGGGTIERGEGDAYTAYNSVYVFTRDGQLSDRYDKIVPLPFGEYIPFGDTFPWLKQMIQGPGDFRAGTRPTVFVGTTADGQPFTYTVPICYEAILQGLMWELFQGDDPGPKGEPYKSEGAKGPVDMFLNITNDAWFGDTGCPHQHAMLAAVQATQFGRPVLRVAYTGINFIVEPHGVILHETKPYTEVAEVNELRLGAVDTLYVKGGRHFSWLCVLASLVAFMVARRRQGPGE